MTTENEHQEVSAGEPVEQDAPEQKPEQTTEPAAVGWRIKRGRRAAVGTVRLGEPPAELLVHHMRIRPGRRTEILATVRIVQHKIKLQIELEYWTPATVDNEGRPVPEPTAEYIRRVQVTEGELVELAEWLNEHVVGVEGLVSELEGGEYERVEWSSLGDEDRLDLWLSMGEQTLSTLVGQMLNSSPLQLARGHIKNS